MERFVTLQLQGRVLNWICEVLSNGKTSCQERRTNQLVPFVVRFGGKVQNIKVWLHNVMLNAIKTAKNSQSDNVMLNAIKTAKNSQSDIRLKTG